MGAVGPLRSIDSSYFLIIGTVALIPVIDEGATGLNVVVVVVVAATTGARE